MIDYVDTEELLRDIECWQRLNMSWSSAWPLIEKCAVAIRQLQERVESERRRLALAEERITALLIEAAANQIKIKFLMDANEPRCPNCNEIEKVETDDHK